MSFNIPFDDRDGEIWYNGQFVPWRESTVHLLSHGLHYASSVFEGTRVYDGEIFKLEEHTSRLFHSAKRLDMQIPYSEDDINKATQEAVKKHNINFGYIRPVVWRGSEQIAISARQTKIHVAIAAWESSTYYDPDIIKQGLKLRTADWRRPAPDTAPVDAKAAGLYMICTLSKHAAENAGYNDALMLDYRGYIAESTGSNIFLIQNGEIHTPLPDCFLNGITRQTVIKIAKKLGYKVFERHLKPEEFANTQEVFLTGTAVELTPVGSIDNYTFTPGDVTFALRDAYQKYVRGQFELETPEYIFETVKVA